MNLLNHLMRAKHNEIGTKPEEESYLHNSTFGKLDVMVKEENVYNEEPMHIQNDNIRCKEELEIKEEPLDFTGENFHSHQIVHTGNKPYHCSHCAKVFSSNTNLIYHKKIHTGEKPYQCTQCNKGFRSNSNLISHQRTHTG
ncbi:unnamed protein product, partial [Meganyctiphanes norvegica]